MSLVEHAKRELELCGQWKEDPAYAQSIVAAVAAFASYGHSGGSASEACEQLHRLLRFETLSELTSNLEEWIDRSEISGTPMWQSTRDPRAFSNDGGKTWWLINQDAGEQPQAAPLYGAWRVHEDPARTGWVTHEGRVIVSTDIDELPLEASGTEAREYPVPLPASEWLELS